MDKVEINKGIKYGIAAGFISTLINDVICLIMFNFMGESFTSFFALIGRSFLTLIHVQVDFPFWQGLALHYSIGVLTGLILGILTQRINILRFNTYKKGILMGVIITQIEGFSLFYLMSLILNIPQSEMMLIYVLGFILHTIWGTSLGVIICYGNKRKSSFNISK